MAPRIPRLLPLLEAGAPRLLRPLTTTARAPSAAVAAAARAQLPADYIPPTQPPSARRPEKREAQLIRSYAAMLRSTPMLLLFQHNNLTAVEWMAVRRELRTALGRVVPGTTPGVSEDISGDIKLEVLKVKMFDVAMRITSFFDAEAAKGLETTPRTGRHGPLVHDLSLAAYNSLKNHTAPPDSPYAQFAPLLTGPVAALVLPSISPPHLAACLSILSPSPAIPAPKKKDAPGLRDPVVQNALSKLILIGGRVEGKVFDGEGVKWVGGIEGGMDGLRSRLVSMLEGVGMGVTGALEGTPKSLWFALEGRKEQLEGKDGPKEGEAAKEETKEGGA